MLFVCGAECVLGGMLWEHGREMGGRVKKVNQEGTGIGESLFTLTFYLINICIRLPDKANKLKSLNIE